MKAKPAIPAPSAPGPMRGEEAFERLFTNEYGRVVAVANRVLADRAEAEDVAQEVFLDFHRRHPDGAAYAPAWLHRAAVHTALNRLRGRRRRVLRELKEHLARPPAVVDPQEVLEVEEDRSRVRSALVRLRPRAAAVLALRYSGLSYVEVGAALNVGANQVGTLLRRAERALTEEMTRGTPV